GARAVEHPGLDPGHELGELLVGAGPRKARAPDVVAEVEVRVVDPHRSPETGRHVADALAVAVHIGNPVGYQIEEVLVVEAGLRGLEHQHRTDVHGGRGSLEVEEGRVDGGQAV